MRRRAPELHELLHEVADVDWRHPAWWVLLGATAFLERIAPAEGAPPEELYSAWLSANGGPRTDTFMARARPAERSAAARVARAVMRARAAAECLASLATALPAQPLLRAVAWQDGWLRRIPLGEGPPRVAFLTPRGVHLATLRPGLAAATTTADEELAGELGAILAGRAAPRPPPDAGAPTPAAIAVSLLEQPLDLARHVHRHAWSASGGPWLGLGDAGELEVVTTCHLVVDGFGHARVSAGVFQRIDADARAGRLAAAAQLGLGGDEPPPVSMRPLAGTEPMGFAARALPDVDGNFPRLAYAFGRALERVFRAEARPDERRAARRSPTFQVPLPPGARSDAARRSKRILIGLVALHMRDGQFEPYPEFRARLAGLLEREAASAGLLSRILRATAEAPLPDTLRRRLLASRGLPHPWLPPVEVLGGRGCLSSLRFDPEPAPASPLYAASSPSLSSSPADGRGAVVLTIVHHPGVISASVCGTGLAASHGGARAFLDTWVEELERVPAGR